MCHDHGSVDVLSTNGSDHLGGSDFDRVLADYINHEFQKKFKYDLKSDRVNLIKLMSAAREAKIDLSNSNSTELFLEIEDDEFELVITRAKFESLISDLINNCIKLTQDAINLSGLQLEDIDEIILVGGSTNIPLVRESVRNYFKGKRICTDISADEAVAIGAAIKAASLGVSKEQKKSTVLQNLTVADITPVHTGVRIKDGKMDVIIKACTHIPHSSEPVRYKTTIDNQEEVEIQVYEGNSPMIKDNHLLGQFIISGFPKKPKGEVKIWVKMSIDTNGIMGISATAEGSDGKMIEQQMQIKTNKSVLTEEQIAQARKEAKLLEDREEERNMIVKSINSLQEMCEELKNTAHRTDPSMQKQIKNSVELIEQFLAEQSGSYEAHIPTIVKYLDMLNDLISRILNAP
jgi:molecular chaperone DnaK (HSP70)